MYSGMLITDNRYFSIAADQLTAELIHHRNKGNKIIWIAEIEPSAYQNITVADNQLIRILRKRDTAQIKKTAARYARPLALKYSFYTRITV